MAQIDGDALTELALYIDNDSYMYRRQAAFVSNVKEKIKRGKYDHSKAPALWKYYVEEGAKRYMKEIAGGGKVGDVFNVPTRNALAKEYADKALNEIKAGRL